ncbi:MAG: Hsp20/alpha crystallin family protein [Bacteroidia bacterium]|nr:Hsp20/alpha crystallin family protein [Bacteroidia bacterium]MBT8268437.1 Hsp20/alpha crystallin family protein [Bacteroidia bacterium]NNF81405.1 Hsp20/alpha crystallin family protein [Flavobacteriaceae bacterium]NNK70488.1 Hsp20/alpha crystallin family protein [Flavobacteriaceae bacterium]NNL80716.1 Hsp20/alpha crystallin family protein [Flavobacteriaceae bacterium]
MTGLIPKSQKDRNRRAYGLTTFPTFSGLFDEFFNEGVGHELDVFGGRSMPAVNIRETDSELNIELAVPGMKKSDFNIDLNESVLTISAETKTEKEEKEDNYTRKEFGFQSFKRSFELPETLDFEKISATYTDGVLVLNLPKKEEIKKPIKTIEIS